MVGELSIFNLQPSTLFLRPALRKNSKGAGLPPGALADLTANYELLPKERVTNAEKDARCVGLFKIPRRKITWTPRRAILVSALRRPARVAELADAVDSKSTDASLVGSTPTPGTMLRRAPASAKHALRSPEGEVRARLRKDEAKHGTAKSSFQRRRILKCFLHALGGRSGILSGCRFAGEKFRHCG